MVRIFREHKVLFVIAILLSLLASVAAIGAAFVLQGILDAVIEADRARLGQMIPVVAAYIVFTTGIVAASSLVEKRLVVKTMEGLRLTLYRGIIAQDAERYRQASTADYLSALTNDVKIIEDSILVPLLQVIQSVLVFLAAVVALFCYSPLIGTIMVACLVAMYAIPALLGKPIGIRQEAYSQNLSLFTGKLKDYFSGYEVIRSFCLSDRTDKDFTACNGKLAASKYGVDRLIAYSEGIAQMVGVGSQIGVMLVSGYLVLQGQMTAGALLAILQLSGCLVSPVAVIMQNAPKIQGAKPILQRIQDMGADRPSSFQGTAEPSFEKEIAFSDVRFSYLPGHPVLEGLDVRFEKGRKYALVGQSGCGKTTLVSLLSGSYGSYGGSISIDGKELHELDQGKVLALMSVIHQDVYMFDETIKDNIDLHRPYSKDEWKRALRTSGVDRFLGQTDKGLDTPVGENGAVLSGGQRQRIAVARALIGGKPLLILDEGTSAVDVRTAYDIETALLGEDDLTMITITHNLSPEILRRYDAVLYLEEGKIAECGSYDALVRQGGAFAASLVAGGDGAAAADRDRSKAPEAEGARIS